MKDMLMMELEIIELKAQLLDLKIEIEERESILLGCKIAKVEKEFHNDIAELKAIIKTVR